MHGVAYLQDLAVVMIVAGVVTLLFLRLKQPVVVGYLLAGVIIGPHTPPFPLIKDPETIHGLADLGMVFLMFALGLDFSLRKLREVGAPALVAATLEIMLMMWIGFEAGYFMGWDTLDRVFLGAGLCISSTAIIVKSLRDRSELKDRHGALISGILVIEDIFVILMIVVLGGISRSGSLPAGEVVTVLLQLFVFLVAAVVVGMLVVPRLLRYAARFRSDEMILVLALAICFGIALLAGRLGYSVALGAFIAGAIVAETRERGRVEAMTAPMRDLFGAVFFIAIGMQFDPSQAIHHAVPVAIILVLFILGKILACGLGSFLAGYDARTALRVGTGMAQLGEFSFVLAALAAQRGAGGEMLYTLFVAVCAVNGIIRPYLVENTERIGESLARVFPAPVKNTLFFYSRWAERMGGARRRNPAAVHIRSLAWQMSLTLALVAAIFIAAAFVARNVKWLDVLPASVGGRGTLWWLVAVVASLPLLVATVRKWQALAMILAEITVTHKAAGSRAPAIRALISNVVFAAGCVALVLFILFLSSALLPPWHTLLALVVVLVIVLVFFGRSFNRSYTRAKFALVEAWNPPPDEHHPARPMPALLRDAGMETYSVPPGPLAGTMIRELQLRTRTGASIVAIERAGRIMVNPSPDEELRVGDSVLLLGDSSQMVAAKSVMADPAAADSALI